MRIVLGATASEPGSAYACDHAVIDLTPTLARKILARFDMVTRVQRADSSAHELHFWDCEVKYFQRTDEDGLDDRVPRDASEFVEIGEGVSIADDAWLWTECEHMVVAVNDVEPEVFWRAMSKHAPLRMQTCALPRRFVTNVANGRTDAPATSFS